jgi:hypothetical protein
MSVAITEAITTLAEAEQRFDLSRTEAEDFFGEGRKVQFLAGVCGVDLGLQRAILKKACSCKLLMYSGDRANLKI